MKNWSLRLHNAANFVSIGLLVVSAAVVAYTLILFWPGSSKQRDNSVKSHKLITEHPAGATVGK